MASEGAETTSIGPGVSKRFCSKSDVEQRREEKRDSHRMVVGRRFVP